MSRRYSSTRFEEENVNCQCFACNVMEHGNQYKYGLELDKKYGPGTADKLSKLAQEHHKFTVGELQEIISDASTQIAFYERTEAPRTGVRSPK